MFRLFQHIIDFIFPPSAEELKIRSIDGAWLLKNAEKARKAEFSFINPIFSYQESLIKELIWQIKYKKNMHAIRCAGYVLYCELNKNYKEARLIPIPISKNRRRERGYNQCELIINEIIRLDSEKKFLADFELLIREKDIEKQTHKNRSERISNIKHIFKVTKRNNLDRKIIIIDDVTTTGSTLKEARDELLKVGYTDVSALSIAH